MFSCAHAHSCFLFLYIRILAAALYGQTEKNTKSCNIHNLYQISMLDIAECVKYYYNRRLVSVLILWCCNWSEQIDSVRLVWRVETWNILRSVCYYLTNYIKKLFLNAKGSCWSMAVSLSFKTISMWDVILQSCDFKENAHHKEIWYWQNELFINGTCSFWFIFICCSPTWNCEMRNMCMSEWIWALMCAFCFRYTKLGYAGNTEPQFIIPSCECLFFCVNVCIV